MSSDTLRLAVLTLIVVALVLLFLIAAVHGQLDALATCLRCLLMFVKALKK